MKDFLILVSVLIYIIVAALGASFMRNAALRKGYGDDIHAWAICFWLGIFGYIYIMALPDKIVQSQNQQIIELIKKENKQ